QRLSAATTWFRYHHDRVRNAEPREEEQEDSREMPSLWRGLLPREKEGLCVLRVRQIRQATRLRVAGKSRRVDARKVRRRRRLARRPRRREAALLCAVCPPAPRPGIGWNHHPRWLPTTFSCRDGTRGRGVR